MQGPVRSGDEAWGGGFPVEVSSPWHDNRAMARPCTICQRVDRATVEQALRSSEPLRLLAARFEITVSGLHRHRMSHMSSKPVPETNHSDDQMEQANNGHAGTEVVVRSIFRIPARPALPQHEVPQTSGGRPADCRVCGSRLWRLLADGRLMCATCHPLRAI
jgi:hypothetical protein